MLSSDYYFPSSGPYAATACIDADTFRPSTKQLAIIEQGFEQVKVYPNPATDVLHLQGLAIGSSWALYDMSGKLLKHEEALSNNLSIDVKDLAAGIYQLKITNKDGREGSAKVMKE
jgi:urea transporter